MAEAGWSDLRPNDHDTPNPLSRVRACTYCGHEEHVRECEALIDPLLSPDAACPCHDTPVPGVVTHEPRTTRFADIWSDRTP